MKVAISTDHGNVSAHFGRCPSYTLLEIQEARVVSKEEIPNPGHSPGFLPQFLSEKGVHYIIAGGMGPRAQNLFTQKKIETIIGVQGKVEEVIERFIRGELEPGEDLCDHQHRHHPGFHTHHQEEMPSARKGKICITSTGKDLAAQVDPRFGRASYFLIVDPETRAFEALENPNKEAGQGAGIQSAQLMEEKGVATVITGECGPNALDVLSRAGIRVRTGQEGKAQDILSRFLSEA